MPFRSNSSTYKTRWGTRSPSDIQSLYCHEESTFYLTQAPFKSWFSHIIYYHGQYILWQSYDVCHSIYLSCDAWCCVYLQLFMLSAAAGLKVRSCVCVCVCVCVMDLPHSTQDSLHCQSTLFSSSHLKSKSSRALWICTFFLVIWHKTQVCSPH